MFFLFVNLEEESLSHQMPPVDKGITNAAHHPPGELGESSAKKDDEPSNWQAGNDNIYGWQNSSVT
jgi:hypothetical protein